MSDQKQPETAPIAPTGSSALLPGLYLRREVQYLLDLGVLISAFFLAYLLRFEFQIPAQNSSNALVQVPIVVLFQFTALLLLGVYQFIWRYVGMAEIGTFARAASYSSVPLFLTRFGLPDAFEQWRIPISVILMDTVFAFGGLLALRVLRRALYERHERQSRNPEVGYSGKPKRTILVGAGRAGVTVAREMLGPSGQEHEPTGFLDDDPRKHGTVIQGIKVLGPTSELHRLILEERIEQVVITMTTAESSIIRGIVETCERAGIDVWIVPALHEILGGRVAVSRLRKVEITDLLGREAVELDEAEVRRVLTGKCVALSGAGGSIGAELARQIARFRPQRLVLIERTEAALFEIDRELRTLWPQLDLEPFLADISDPNRMRWILSSAQPDVVFHAAAHKHVPMMEQHPSEAIKNNVLGTEAFGSLAGEFGVETFVLVSTDKAVRPTSIMGASKRVAELVIQDLDVRFDKTRFLAVRFGNVLDSAGSVVPIFREQINRGGPLTVTHPDATRYFMTIPEAAQLVLEAGAIGESGQILILDMGEPVKVLDLAQDMITLSGFKPYDEIDIAFTGLRQGEKLFEELELSGENISNTVHPKIFVGDLAAYPTDRISAALATLRHLAGNDQPGEIRRFLADLLPEAQLERRLKPRQPDLGPRRAESNG